MGMYLKISKIALVLVSVAIEPSVYAQTETAAPSTINNAAGEAKDNQLQSIALNVAGAGMMYAGCTSHRYYLCIMGAMAMAQAGAASSAARGSGVTFDASKFGFDNTLGSSETIDPYNPKFTDPAAQTAFQKYKDAGFTINPDGSVTDPSGTWKAEDFKSQDSMMAKGLSASQASSALSTLAAINKDLAKKAGEEADSSGRVIAMALDGSGGGGGGGRSLASEGSEDFDFNSYLNKLRGRGGLSANEKQKLLAGKTVSAGEDSIGVRVDDIFRMIHHRYQEKRSSNDFIEVGLSGPLPPAQVGRKNKLGK